MIVSAAINQPEPQPVAPQEYETFAQSLVKKYGFCNWQCKDAWEAGYSAALATQAPGGSAPAFRTAGGDSRAR